MSDESSSLDDSDGSPRRRRCRTGLLAIAEEGILRDGIGIDGLGLFCMAARAC